MTRGGQRAECEIWSHGDGEELRLLMEGDEPTRTYVSDSRAELLKMQHDSRVELEQQGWTKIWPATDYSPWPGECSTPARAVPHPPGVEWLAIRYW